MVQLDEKLGLIRNLEDIERIRRILGVERLTLMGHSFGGYLAVLYALEFPNRVERMILIEPADMLRFPNAHGGLAAVEEWLDDGQMQAWKAFQKEYFNYGKFYKRTEEELAELNRGYGEFYFQALTNSGIDEPVYDPTPVKNGGFAGHAMFFSQPRKYDIRGQVKTITVPTMIIRGTRDLFSPEVTAEYHALLENSVYTELENSTHFPFYEEPELFREKVAEFLTK